MWNVDVNLESRPVRPSVSSFWKQAELPTGECLAA